MLSVPLGWALKPVARVHSLDLFQLFMNQHKVLVGEDDSMRTFHCLPWQGDILILIKI